LEGDSFLTGEVFEDESFFSEAALATCAL
jgi:hypothetical protein